MSNSDIAVSGPRKAYGDNIVLDGISLDVAAGSVFSMLGPFFSSAIVPAAKMGTGVRQFAEYQPFTPITEALRGLLAGAPSGGYVIAALAWCGGIAIVGYVWAVATFRKRA